MDLFPGLGAGKDWTCQYLTLLSDAIQTAKLAQASPPRNCVAGNERAALSLQNSW
jgi:hypothetical protein